jgi:type II secretory pathway pseudopilin PulG
VLFRSVSAAAWNIDLAGLYDLVTQTVKAIGSAQEYAEFEKGRTEAEGRLGFKIRQDLLAGLSGPMALYSVEVPNSGLRAGATLVVKLRQPEAVDKALAALAKMATEDGKGSVSAGTTVQDGYTVHCISPAQLTLLGLMPTWVVAKDRLLVATNSGLATQALRQLISGAPVKSPLRTSASYKQVCARMPDDPLAVRFTDSAHHVRLSLETLRPYWPLLTVAVARTGMQLPVALPTFDRIVDQLPPSGLYCWREQSGLRWHGEGPSIGAKGIAAAAIAAAVTMPAMARARTTAERAVSMNNLKQIGLGCVMYADDHNDVFPPNLQTLVEKQLVRSQVLQPPAGRGASRYVYIADQTTKTDMNNILAYEDPAQAKDKVCALFPDGHVEALSREAFQKKLAETYKRLGREMPK